MDYSRSTPSRQPGDGTSIASAPGATLRAGRKAKASAAHGSACAYFAAVVALLSEGDWDSQYELTFSLSLERAECEVLTGNFEKAEQLIVELLQRATSKLDQAPYPATRLETIRLLTDIGLLHLRIADDLLRRP
jgi:predicted ATPase